MNEAVIQVENLAKQYRLGNIGTGSFSSDFKAWLYSIRGKENPFLKIGEENDRTKKGVSEYVWALKDINFEVRRGDVLGIIGRNGAGKSTLLKILSRTTLPTLGSVKMRGRIASLLEVGTGFHPELSGRENVMLNGAILGMSKAEIKSKFDEIIDFAGIEKYLDTPVKRYSSGMYVRLAFAVAAHLEPEILIVDEVLAVGDAEFQKKALGKMQEVSEGQGRTVLFVSHSMASIKKLCSSCMILGNGKLEYHGTTTTAIEKYLNLETDPGTDLPAVLGSSDIAKYMDGIRDSNMPFLALHQITLLNSRNLPCSSFSSQDEIKIKFEFDIHFVAPDFRIVVSIVDEENTPVLTTQLTDSEVHESTLHVGSYAAVCNFPPNLFATSTYVLSIQFINVKKEHYIYNGIVKFRVQYDNPKYIYAPFDKTYFRPFLKWELQKQIQHEK